MKTRFFGVSLPGTVWVLFFWYSVLTLAQKSVSVQKLQLVLGSLSRKDWRYLFPQLAPAVLGLKEGVFLWIEKMYVEKRVELRYEEAAKEAGSCEAKRQRVLEQLNSVGNEREIATDEIRYVQKYVVYLFRLVSVLLSMGYRMHSAVLVHTGMFLAADLGLVLATRKAFVAHRAQAIQYQNATSWVVDRRSQLGEQAAYLKYQEASGQFRQQAAAYQWREFLLKAGRSVLLSGYVAVELVYLVRRGTYHETVYFTDISKKLDKLVNCVIKVL